MPSLNAAVGIAQLNKFKNIEKKKLLIKNMKKFLTHLKMLK